VAAATVVATSGNPLQVQPGDVLWGRFRVEEPLGQGGMGAVYRAVDTALNDEVVAVKLLTAPAGDDHARQRIKQEVQQARMLRHPGVVGVFEYYEDGSHIGFSMEYLPGATLQEHLDGRVPRSPLAGEPTLARVEDVSAIADQLGEAIDFIHARGLIHRDIKPSNVMLARSTEDASWQVKLMDFGIVHARAGSALTGQVQPGTLAYMAPELLEGATPTKGADLFSFGKLLYHALTGVNPRIALGMMGPSEHLEGLPSEVDEVVMACFRDSGARPGTAAQVAGVLREAAAEGARRREEEQRRERAAAEAEEQRTAEERERRVARAVDRPPRKRSGARLALIVAGALVSLVVLGLLGVGLVVGLESRWSTDDGEPEDALTSDSDPGRGEAEVADAVVPEPAVEEAPVVPEETGPKTMRGRASDPTYGQAETIVGGVTLDGCKAKDLAIPEGVTFETFKKALDSIDGLCLGDKVRTAATECARNLDTPNFSLNANDSDSYCMFRSGMYQWNGRLWLRVCGGPADYACDVVEIVDGRSREYVAGMPYLTSQECESAGLSDWEGSWWGSAAARRDWPTLSDETRMFLCWGRTDG